MLKYYILTLGFFLSFAGFAQVLDDSTKQIYTNKTVEFFYENDVLRNINRIHNPDSTLDTYQYTNPNRKSGWMYQDLGSVGTASKPVLFMKNMEIGQQMGLEVNRLYAPKLQDFKFYNTRSPYTYLAYLQGGGQTQFEITHSQNINPRLNLTFNIFKFNSEKQFGYTRSGEVLVNHWQYNISSNYTSENKKYKVLGVFYHFNHKHEEQGGVAGGDTLKLKQIESKYSRVYDAALTGNIFNRERWNNFHLYQQFVMKNSLQTFHILDYERKFYSFEDPSFGNASNAAIYGIDMLSIPTDTMAYHQRFQSVSNKFGFKGLYKGFNYQVYGRHRIYNLTNKFYSSYAQKWTNELYVGGLVGYVFPDSTNTLDASLEVASDKNYLLDATLFYKGFEVNFYNSAVPAGLFYQKFRNDVINFNNTNLNSINSKHLAVKFPVKYKSFTVLPEARWSSIANYTYLLDPFTVLQEDGDVNLLTFGVGLKYFSKNFTARHNYYFNTTNNSLAYPVPKHIHVTNLEYNFLYAKVLRIYLGTDFYFKSAYYGNSYSPLLNQFYRNNNLIAGVPVMDVYVKFPISKGRISLNWTYANKSMGFVDIQNFGKNGLFTTPGYLGQSRALMIKIDWPLFD